MEHDETPVRGPSGSVEPVVFRQPQRETRRSGRGPRAMRERERVLHLVALSSATPLIDAPFEQRREDASADADAVTHTGAPGGPCPGGPARDADDEIGTEGGQTGVTLGARGGGDQHLVHVGHEPGQVGGAGRGHQAQPRIGIGLAQGRHRGKAEQQVAQPVVADHDQPPHVGPGRAGGAHFFGATHHLLEPRRDLHDRMVVPMGPRLILFDLDGTLVDTAGAGLRALERAFVEVFDMDGIDARATGVPFAGRTDPIIVRGLARAWGIEANRLETRRLVLIESYVRALDDEMRRPDPKRRALRGVPELLRTLDEHPSARLGLVTGNIEQGARIKLEPFGLNRFFPGGGFGSDHEDRHEVARLAVKKLSPHYGVSFDATSVVVIGDTPHDVASARANGFHAVAVDSGWADRRELERAAPDVLFDDLTERDRVLEALGLALPDVAPDNQDHGLDP